MLCDPGTDVLYRPRQATLGSGAFQHFDRKRRDIIIREVATVAPSLLSAGGIPIVGSTPPEPSYRDDLTRIGGRFLARPDYSMDEIAVGRYLKNLRVVTGNAIMELECGINNLAVATAQVNAVAVRYDDGRRLFPLEHQGVQRGYDAIDNLLSGCLATAFKLGCFEGQDEGRRVLLRVYGDDPRVSKLYSIEQLRNYNGSAGVGARFVSLRIRLRSRDEMDCGYRSSKDILATNLSTLTKQILKCYRRRTRSILHPVSELPFGPMNDGQESIEKYLSHQERFARREYEERENIFTLYQMMDRALSDAFEMGKQCGYESGQQRLKIEFSFQNNDQWVYSFWPADVLVIARTPIECSCSDCPLCLGSI